MKRNLLTAATLIASIGAASAGHAGTVTTIAAFDYGTSGSPVQAGFTQVTTSTTVTTNGDGIGIVMDRAATGTRDRGAVSHPQSDLLRDLFFVGDSNPVTFTLSGLDPNKTYTVIAYAFDSASGNNGKILEWTTNGGTVTHTTNSSDPASGKFTLAPLTTDGAGFGTITAEHTGGAGGAAMPWNGFEIQFEDDGGTVIPTPSAAIAGLVGLGALAARRRRRG